MGLVQRAVLLAMILAPAGLGVLGSASSRSPRQTSKALQAGANGDIAWGRYLAEEVARCYECHTPRNAQGDLRRDEWLQGAPIWIQPVQPNPNWAERAPALA